MKSLDIDGNGTVDFTEFITAAIDKVALLNKENLKAAFDLIDNDKSGFITINELKAAFDSHGEKDVHIWTDIMKEVDSNQDD
jgi:calcium-dependent protein kinase